MSFARAKTTTLTLRRCGLMNRSRRSPEAMHSERRGDFLRSPNSQAVHAVDTATVELVMRVLLGTRFELRSWWSHVVWCGEREESACATKSQLTTNIHSWYEKGVCDEDKLGQSRLLHKLCKEISSNLLWIGMQIEGRECDNKRRGMWDSCCDWSSDVRRIDRSVLSSLYGQNSCCVYSLKDVGRCDKESHFY